jgi:mannose-1-phosphate guanylyltransferase
MNQNNYVIIMAGGTGTRLWPVSTSKKPKQFHDLLGLGKTLLQMTYERFLAKFPKENIYIVTNKEYEGLIKEQIEGIDGQQLLLEPYKRNTAPCIAYAAYKIASRNPEASMVIAPADHLILKEDIFHQSIAVALDSAAKNDQLITLGMHPNRPETGYGYIQFIPDSATIKKVKTFTEKPELALAKKFIESGDFVWNTGTFVWKNESIINAFEKYLPEMAEVFEEGSIYFCTDKESQFLIKAYSLIRNISIDTGILEKSNEVFVVLGEYGWSDLGSWQNLYEISEKDEERNSVKGKAMLYETNNCFINMPPNKLVVVQGLSDYLISDSEDVLLICKLGASSKYREYVTDARKIDEKYI